MFVNISLVIAFLILLWMALNMQKLVYNMTSMTSFLFELRETFKTYSFSDLENKIDKLLSLLENIRDKL